MLTCLEKRIPPINKVVAEDYVELKKSNKKLLKKKTTPYAFIAQFCAEGRFSDDLKMVKGNEFKFAFTHFWGRFNGCKLGSY